MKLVVRPEAVLIGRSARDLSLRTRYGLNLLAVSRNGSRSKSRLRTLKIQAGDLLLMQGPLEALTEFAADSGCVPLAERELRIPDRRKAWTAGAIMLSLLIVQDVVSVWSYRHAFDRRNLLTLAFGALLLNPTLPQAFTLHSPSKVKGARADTTTGSIMAATAAGSAVDMAENERVLPSES